MLDAEMENAERPGDDSADSDENEGRSSTKFLFSRRKKTSFRLEGGISGRLPGEDPDEPAEATRESQTTTQAHSDNDDDNEHDQD